MVLVVRVVGYEQCDAAGREVRRDPVDVTVGRHGTDVAGHPVGHPHDGVDAEVVTEAALDLVLGHVGIPVRTEQAHLCRQQCALAVGQDRAALEHERRLEQPHAEVRGNGCWHRVIVRPRREPLAPRVETERHRRDLARVVTHEDRPRVAHPRVVDRDRQHLHRLPAGIAHALLVARVADHDHRLGGGDRAGDAGPLAACVLGAALPVVRLQRPRHQGCGVRRPLRRHRVPLLHRGCDLAHRVPSDRGGSHDMPGGAGSAISRIHGPIRVPLPVPIPAWCEAMRRIASTRLRSGQTMRCERATSPGRMGSRRSCPMPRLRRRPALHGSPRNGSAAKPKT